MLRLGIVGVWSGRRERRVLDRRIATFRRVVQLAGDGAAHQLARQQAFLFLDLLEHALVFVRSSGQVGQHLVDWPVGDVLVGGVTRLT